MSYYKLELIKTVAYEIDSIPFPIQGWVYKYENQNSDFRWQTSHRSDEEPDTGNYSSAADAEYDMDSYADGITSDNIREFSI